MQNITTTNAERTVIAKALVNEKWVTTDKLVALALEVAWTAIDHSPEGARDFYRSIKSRRELRWLAAQALAAIGWTTETLRQRMS